MCALSCLTQPRSVTSLTAWPLLCGWLGGRLLLRPVAPPSLAAAASAGFDRCLIEHVLVSAATDTTLCEHHSSRSWQRPAPAKNARGRRKPRARPCRFPSCRTAVMTWHDSNLTATCSLQFLSRYVKTASFFKGAPLADPIEEKSEKNHIKNVTP